MGENSKEAILQRRACCWAGHIAGLDRGSGGKNREVQSLDIFVNDLNRNKCAPLYRKGSLGSGVWRNLRALAKRKSVARYGGGSL